MDLELAAGVVLIERDALGGQVPQFPRWSELESLRYTPSTTGASETADVFPCHCRS